MKTHCLFRVLTLILILAGLASCSKKSSDITGLSSEMFNNIEWRKAGPGAYGGRISEIIVHPANDSIIFVSPSTGGIFKSSDACLNWIPVFDLAGSSISIGDMDISSNNPDLLWAGTGEASGEQSPSTVGDGIYRSVDGGLTWNNMGLEKCRHFSKVVIHPQDDNTVFAGATGGRWGADEDRGVFRTTDGGMTWEKVLFINNNTGIGDIAIHPDGKTVFASAWEQMRNAWAHVRQGPNSGLYRSDDTGSTWNKVEDGLPEGKSGRIAIAIAPSDPEIIYACYEHDSLGLFRSEDKGQTWKNINNKVSTSYWYGRIYVDPTDENHLWVMGVWVQESFDGGKTFSPVRMEGVHVDHHVLWINPDNTAHRLLGNDGGLYFTTDGGDKWVFAGNLPIGQYYDISTDNSTPYRIYGGLQDNGVWGGPSRSANGRPVSNSDIINVSGGDGFYSANEPEEQEIVYGESQYGNIVRLDRRTGERTRIRPRPESKDEEYRFNWNTPFFVSRHSPHSLYIGAQKILKSTNRGKSWKEVSPDLSKNLKLDTILVIGQKPVLKPYCTITTLAESPLRKGLIYAGTDDGNIYVTLNDGETWENLSENLPAPADRFITRVMPSSHKEGRIYTAFGRFYEANVLSPYLYVSDDYGKTWKDIGCNLQEEVIVKGLAEHHDNPDLLFAGAHNGLFVSIDGGESWTRMHGDMPYVAIEDIEIHKRENSLILGTYGRGLWIQDNIAYLTGLTVDSLKEEHLLFDPVYLESGLSADSVFEPAEYNFIAPEPDEGLNIYYYLREEPKQGSRHMPVITIENTAGETIFTKELDPVKGFNRIVWAEGSDNSEYHIKLKTKKKESVRSYNPSGI